MFGLRWIITDFSFAQIQNYLYLMVYYNFGTYPIVAIFVA